MIASRWFSLLLLLAAGLLLTPATARAAGPTLAPAAPDVAAGQSISFSGEGFVPEERLSVWVTTPNQVVLGAPYAFADDNGRTTITFRVPGTAVSGTWAITAYGIVSQTPAIATFTVAGVEPDAAPPPAAVAPAAAPAGTRFSFAATGFDDNEPISYWFTGPDGNVHDAYNQTRRSDRNGRVDFRWTSPEDAIPGTWVITIQGIRNGVVRAVPFEIQPAP
ncbi:MAG: hypothetical protein DIU80_015460 [Chloroflexota bacterium]|nr:MAG: hypothetical protein DIU80_08945 [Chloroflexota bacterium]